VVFIDLDGFKEINDTRGHAVGDDVLRSVGRRVSRAVRASDRVARLGGDEFVVLIAPLSDRSVAEATGRRILSALTQPVHVDGEEVPLAASVGVALADDPNGASPAGLMALADQAMYQAKHGGGGHLTIVPGTSGARA
jgi:diguanylate cyclase (GGDEF)-like protein